MQLSKSYRVVMDTYNHIECCIANNYYFLPVYEMHSDLDGLVDTNAIELF